MRAILRPGDAERALADELDFHLAMQTEKHRAAGMDAADADLRARLEFGNVGLVKEDARDARGTQFVDDTMRDLRYAVRAIARAPVFALTVVGTISLAVGLNAAAFTVFDAYVLRPLDVRDPSSLYALAWLDRSGRVRSFDWSDYVTLRRASPGYTAIAAVRTIAVRLRGSNAVGDAVSSNYFELLGVVPAIGSTLAGRDDQSPVDAPDVVLGHALWQSRFGGDSGVVGQHVLLRGHPFRVVGVARAGFEGLYKKPRDFWIPLGALSLLDDSIRSTPATLDGLSLIGRLAPGESPSKAGSAASATMRALTAPRPAADRADRVILTSRARAITPSIGAYAAFAPIAIAFGLVLLLACANVANMMLARGLARQRELGVRLALGATRARLVRQLVVESLLLALPAIGLGFAAAWLIVTFGVRTLFATLPHDLVAFVRLVPLHPDARVLAYTAAVALASALIFGLAPSLQSTRLSVVEATRGEFGRLGSPAKLRTSLIIAQVAIASLLMTAASVLLRQSARLSGVETGIRTRDVISVESGLDRRSDVLRRLNANPVVGLLAAAATPVLDANLPTLALSRGGSSTDVSVAYNRVSSGFFGLLGIPIVAGRAFQASDEAGGETAIVSEAAARRIWPAGNAIGQTISLRVRGERGTADSLDGVRVARVVGVARNVITPGGAADASIVYLPTSPRAAACCLFVRARGDVAVAQRTIAADLDRFVPGAVDRLDRLDTFVAGAIYPYRAAYWVALVLGGLALALTVAGVHGVIAYIVAQRTREIGVRIALGATARDVLIAVLSQTTRHALIGVGAGAVLALGLARALASAVQQMPGFDPVAALAAIAIVLAACIAAVASPTRRATRIDPNVALRYE